MSDSGRGGRRLSRETRLLVVTILVSAVVLLLLAQLRFPGTPSGIVTTTQPLDRLAARASYDDLATSIARLEDTISPNLLALRLEARADTTPRQLNDVLSFRGVAADGVRHVPALRIDTSAALAVIEPGTRISAVVGRAASGSAGIMAADPVNRIARVQVPEGPVRPLRHVAFADLRTPAYIVAVEGTGAGVTLRPVFLGRTGQFGSPRWTRALLPLGGATVTPGALMFTLAGEFLGCAVIEDGTLAIASAADVLDAAGRLTAPPVMPTDAGIAVQPLTGPLAAATGVPRGVVVSEVFEDGLSDGVLEAGDVIIEIDGHSADSPEWLLLQLATRLSAGPVQVIFARDRNVRTVTLSADTARTGKSHWDEAVTLEPARGIGSRVLTVRRGTAFDLAGLQAGDVIVQVGNVTAPAPTQVMREIADARAGEFLLIAVRRDERQRMLSVHVPPRHDAARR
jgi:hypothetical protein